MHTQHAASVILFLLVSCTSAFASSDIYREQTNLEFVSVPLQDFTEETRSLFEFVNRGKWQVVMLWSSYCEVSDRKMQQYVSFNEKNKNSDISFIGISIDGIDNKHDSQAFMKSHAMSFTNLIGDYETVSRYFLSETGEPSMPTPSFLLYSPSGKLVASQAGAIPPELISNFIQNEKITLSRK